MDVITKTHHLFITKKIFHLHMPYSPLFIVHTEARIFFMMIYFFKPHFRVLIQKTLLTISTK